MWSTVEVNGGFSCRNGRTNDLTDSLFATKEEAEAWADATNKATAQRLAASKTQANERKKKRASSGPLADQFFIDPDAE